MLLFLVISKGFVQYLYWHNNAAHTLISCTCACMVLAWLWQSCAPETHAAWGQRKLTFTFDKLRIRLGPKWLDFPLQAGQLGTTCGLSSALQSNHALMSRQNGACMHACAAAMIFVQLKS